MASGSTNTVALTVAANPTSFTIKVNGGSSTSISAQSGGKATLTVVGLPAGAQGKVTFKTAHATLCVVTLPATSCKTTATLKVGAYTPISAIFTPTDANFTGSTSNNTVSLKNMSKPGTPTHVHATKVSAKKITVSWVAPTNNGGSRITGYVVSYGRKSVWVNGSTKQVTVVGLALGKYHFQVRAINKLGAGIWSGASNTISIAKP